MASSGEELALSNKLKQKSVVERIWQIKAGKKPAPWVVELDPTSACNLACHGCISANLLNHGGFTKERLISLAHEIVEAGVKAVILIGGGEPMAHPAFGEIVNIFGESGVHVGVTTNGTLIDRYREPLAKYAQWVRVSVDAGTSETYRRFRPALGAGAYTVSKFELVIRNMREYAKVKTGKLGYSFLIMTDKNGSNAGDIYEAGKAAKDVGCDYVEYKPAYDDNHFLIGQERDIVFLVKEQIAAVRALADTNFKVIAPVTLTDVLEGKPLVQPKQYTRCPVAELRTLVTHEGSYICPYYRGKRAKQTGDLKRQSFKEMWDGQTRAAALADTDPSRDCGFHCIRHQSNLQLEDWTGSDVVEDYDWFV